MLQELSVRLDTLIFFRNLAETPLLSALSRFCRAKKSDAAEKLSAYCDFVAALYAETDDLTDYIVQLVLENENPYICRVGAQMRESACMDREIAYELSLFQEIATLTPEKLCEEFRPEEQFKTVQLPTWKTHAVDLVALYHENLANIHKNGYGIYARYAMFGVNDTGKLVPVQYPDAISLEQMIGYTRERQIVIDNTKALLEGKPAANVLLCGDAGTGKSATVKAIVNKYWKDGLRLIELQKDQLRFLPRLMDQLCKNPLKFIFFVDDLTFTEESADFGTLKAILEGSAAARAKNTAIYATSNRRHLVKETFDDGSDMHHNDTTQERVSLSERFGISVTFMKPEKKLYLEIVHALAEQEGLDLPEDVLDQRAEQFAMQKYGRSARAARQFVELELSR